MDITSANSLNFDQSYDDLRKEMSEKELELSLRSWALIERIRENLIKARHTADTDNLPLNIKIDMDLLLSENALEACKINGLTFYNKDRVSQAASSADNSTLPRHGKFRKIIRRNDKTDEESLA